MSALAGFLMIPAVVLALMGIGSNYWGWELLLEGDYWLGMSSGFSLSSTTASIMSITGIGKDW